MIANNLIYTLTAPYQFQQEIRKSIFLAHAVPVYTEMQVGEWLQRLKIPEATHNCWAYRIGQNYKSNDDGEPSGTAGRPILQVIERQNFDCTLVIVIRWFGGIKLGAGGLIRAYSGTAAECLRQSSSKLYIPKKEIIIVCSFSDYALVKVRIGEYQAEIAMENFESMDVECHLVVPEEQYLALKRRLIDLTRGQILIEDINR